jgi:hypothetical protein
MREGILMRLLMSARPRCLQLLALVVALFLGAAQVQAAKIDLGIKIDVSGSFSDGTTFSTTVYDKDIHSGVFRDVHAFPSLESGSPLFSDSYVLQGGDPFGGDTGDDFEVSQASGHLSVGPDAAHQLLLTTSYAFAPINPTVGPDGNPDTGFLTVTNNSAFDFAAPIMMSGLSGIGNLESQIFTGVIPSGGSIIMTLDNESSNQGGFNAVPEPSSLVLCGIGAVGLLGVARRRLKK